MSNFKRNRQFSSSEESHHFESQQMNQSNEYQSMHESEQNIERFSQNKMQQISKNISFQSQLSQEDHISLNEENNQFIEGNNDIIIFSKNNSKNQRLQNPSQMANSKSIETTLLYPWLNQKTLTIQNPLLKFHNEIIDYFLMFQEQEEAHNHLLYNFNKLQGLLFKTFKNCDVLAPFLVNRVYLKNSEVEIFILFDESNLKSSQTIEKVKQCLEKTNFEQIRFFQVPSQEGRQNKIGFNCLIPQKNYQVQIKIVTKEWISYLSMINDTLQNNLQSKFLFLIFDTMIRQRGMQNAVKGYFLFGLISVFLSQRRRQRSRSLTENVLKFLQYFGVGPFTERKITFVGMLQFNLEKHEFEISVDSQQNNMGGQFSFWIGPNVDISSHMARQFFSILRNRYRLISNFNFANSPSVLSSLINPSQEQFRY